MAKPNMVTSTPHRYKPDRSNFHVLQTIARLHEPYVLSIEDSESVMFEDGHITAEDFVKRWAPVPKVVLTDDVITAFRNHADAVNDHVTYMLEDGIFRLPLPRMVIEHRSQVGDDVRLGQVWQFTMLEEDPTNPYMINMWVMDISDNGMYGTLEVQYRFNFEHKTDVVGIKALPTEYLKRSRQLQINDERAVTNAKLYLADIYMAVLSFKTRETQVTDVLPSRDSVRLARLRNQYPVHEHKIIRLNPATRDNVVKHGFSVAGIELKYHQRAGHWKTVRCGPGRRDRREVFVESYWCGNPQRGTITHDYVA